MTIGPPSQDSTEGGCDMDADSLVSLAVARYSARGGAVDDLARGGQT